jgi:hypothetical protein
MAAGRESCSTTSKEGRWTTARSTARSMATRGSGGSTTQVRRLTNSESASLRPCLSFSSEFLICGFRSCAGHYPVWDEQNPVHFVGHSAGAQVVRVLHQMLADKVRQEVSDFTWKRWLFVGGGRMLMLILCFLRGRFLWLGVHSQSIQISITAIAWSLGWFRHLSKHFFRIGPNNLSLVWALGIIIVSFIFSLTYVV